MPKKRIISLIASATEIACALGFEDSLVGRSHECDYPPSVHRLPVCTAPRFDVAGSSRDIDNNVKSLMEQAASIYAVNAELLRELRPDVILTQAQCDVCAVSTKDVENALCDWTGTRPRVVTLQPDCLADVWQDIRRAADALDVPRQGDELVQELKERMEAIAAKARAAPHRPTVACLEWLDPLMAAGNWVPELVEMAGGVNLFGEAGKHAPWMSWAELSERDPEVIVAMPCGFDLERTRKEMKQLPKHPEWGALRAVQNGRVYATDGNQFFNRPGPRLVESLAILAGILHGQENVEGTLRVP
ncbi:MAG: cobalamin-binding protein [Gemmataceae bacterium]|nr:cobalamin-binding protein [Gemmataceae bacterium]MCI0738844.1 cobalamin-binding protein [Gemmataceae bacterium]